MMQHHPERSFPRAPSFVRHAALTGLGLLATLGLSAPSTAHAQQDTAGWSKGPRVGLAGGLHNAEDAIRGLRHVSMRPKQAGWFNPRNLGDFAFANSDLAFRGNLMFQGGWRGWQAWDISNPKSPQLRTAMVCQGGQGDLSVHGNLLFMSVEDLVGRLDCGVQGISDSVSSERFRGVRIFDISNLDRPVQVAAVQTCRGSHTHTLVTDPKDRNTVYVYVQGTGPVRSPSELAGCVADASDRNSSLFRIEVIKVPLSAPQTASVVNMPRIFADASGKIGGLWQGGDHGAGTQTTGRTDQCHDITAYPEIGLAAGACSGNGILLDISNPANPKRVDEVMDPNFAYWHSATFNNDGRAILFTDEWGGGTAARCRATDRLEWGANAIFTLNAKKKLTMAGYYKLPAVQSAVENCVAHNGSLIPVPGRDIMVQAWYQGGLSVFDFSDPSKPVELAYYDRGPIDPTKLTLAGFWSVYWYNGLLYASEIGRGLDIFELAPSDILTQNEINAAMSVRVNQLNPQLQQKFEWPPSFSLARAYVDQLARGRALREDRTDALTTAINNAEVMYGPPQRNALNALAASVDRDVNGSSDGPRVKALSAALRNLAKMAR